MLHPLFIPSIFKLIKRRETKTMEIFGTVRKVDATGRIALPAEMRRTLGLTGGDTVEIVSEGAALVLRKYQPTCFFCSGARDIYIFRGKNICRRCLEELELWSAPQAGHEDRMTSSGLPDPLP